MKVCNTLAMKMIKEYEEQKRLIISQENECCVAMYKEGEEKLVGDYDYSSVRGQVKELDKKIRDLRVALAKANCTVIVEGFDITIGEALILLAQLQGEKSQVESLAKKRQLSRRLTLNGVLEFTECLYSVEEAKKDVKRLRDEISALQMAIDRANLSNEIEI